MAAQGSYRLSIGRLAWFIAAMLFAGLLQLWFLAGEGFLLSGDIKIAELCGKGELAFFSTAIIASSAFTLLSSDRPFTLGGLDGLSTLVFGLTPFVVAIWSYLSSVSNSQYLFKHPEILIKYIFVQAACALFGFFYAFYVAVVTGALVQRGAQGGAAGVSDHV